MCCTSMLPVHALYKTIAFRIVGGGPRFFYILERGEAFEVAALEISFLVSKQYIRDAAIASGLSLGNA